MSKTINLQLLTLQVVNLARATGIFLKNEVNKLSIQDIESKGAHDFVSYVDKTSERQIIEELRKILPEAGFIAEESTDLLPADRFNWVVDPLDGTTNFIHRLPLFSISIALLENDEIISGVIFEPNQNECFYAWKGSQAYLNQRVINVSQPGKIEDCLFATGFPYYDYSRLDNYLELFKFLLKNSHGIRRLGSAAVDLAYVACGRFEGFYEYGLHPWDVAAGALIVKQAGGKVSDFTGQGNFVFGREIVATNHHIYNEFMREIKNYFDKN